MELSLAEARRLTLSAQGLTRRPARPTIADVRRVAAKVVAIRVDSIDVLARSHYLVPNSRLGPYQRDALDRLAYDRRELFEWSGPSTCLVPVDLFPLARYRMEQWQKVGAFGPRGERPDDSYIEAVYREVAARGPITVAELSEPGEGRGKWWGWSDGKIALEFLWNCGRIAISGRDRFIRLYDITERVIPGDVLDTPSPDPEESQKQLMCVAVKALGVATGYQLAEYFGLHHRRVRQRGADGKVLRPVWPRLLRELTEDGRLVPMEVEVWSERGYVVPRTRVPASVAVRALISPFDTLMWGSADLCFDFSQPLAQQLYVPADQRVYGYYVLPFLLGDELVGRCDLKADRKTGRLVVQAAYAEPGQNGKRVAAELAAELRLMQTWLELDSIDVVDHGNLAAALRAEMRGQGPTRSHRLPATSRKTTTRP